MDSSTEEVDNETTNTISEPPQIIETGDSVKVKQVLDDATMEAVSKLLFIYSILSGQHQIKSCGYDQNYSWENLKLFLMFLSCLFAVVAQFFPIPFPKSRPLLGVCCVRSAS